MNPIHRAIAVALSTTLSSFHRPPPDLLPQFLPAIPRSRGAAPPLLSSLSYAPLLADFGGLSTEIFSAMASLTMASSVAAATTVLAAPVAAASVSFSTSSTVKVAPAKANRRLSVVTMATPRNKEDMKDQIPNAIAEAQKTCEDDPTSAPCAVAWDEVEELTAAAAHQRERKKSSSDPLEAYCTDNPEADECRTYED